MESRFNHTISSINVSHDECGSQADLHLHPGARQNHDNIGVFRSDLPGGSASPLPIQLRASIGWRLGKWEFDT